MRTVAIILILLGVALLSHGLIKNYYFWNENIGGLTRKALYYEHYYTLRDIERFKRAGFIFYSTPTATELNTLLNTVWVDKHNSGE